MCEYSDILVSTESVQKYVDANYYKIESMHIVIVFYQSNIANYTSRCELITLVKFCFLQNSG